MPEMGNNVIKMLPNNYDNYLSIVMTKSLGKYQLQFAF